MQLLNAEHLMKMHQSQNRKHFIMPKQQNYNQTSLCVNVDSVVSQATGILPVFQS